MDHDVTLTIFFAGYLVFTEIRNYMERKTLTEKLMSKSLADYSAWQAEQRKTRIGGFFKKDDKNIQL